MIKQIAHDNFEEITDIIERFVASREGAPQPQIPFIDQIRNGLEKERVGIYASYDGKNQITGFSVINLERNGISLMYIDKSLAEIGKQDFHDVEKTLFDKSVERLKENGSHVRVGIFEISESLSNHIVTHGFHKYDRARMAVERQAIERLESPILPKGYTFGIYSSEMRESMAELVYKSNVTSVDVNVFPEFFGSYENCIQLLENIENHRYGKYKDGQSITIMKDDECVGVCFMTLVSDDTGYIPEIVIDPSHRRRGLGRAILVHSMKTQASVEEELAKVDLDVTLANHALKMYQSVGFKETRTYSMYSLEDN
ncbi:MAG: GNAT family N-acetyltransferase [Candidatus Thorarchaeota archaeon]